MKKLPFKNKEYLFSFVACLASCLCLALALNLLKPSQKGNVYVAMGIFDSLDSLKEVGKWAGKAEKIVSSTQKATQEITPDQEYYIGRAVAATIMRQYKPWNNQMANGYINLLGKALANASDMPQTFGGYHFQVLDSSELNAFAAPGGLILVTRGMLGICTNEAELAAVLAHEIAHVQLRHGVAAIKQSRVLDLGGLLIKEGTQEFGSSDLKQLTGVFGDTVSDVTETLLQNGYSRDQECDADKVACVILDRVGYSSKSLINMLKKMKNAYPEESIGFAKTHPDPLDRVESIKESIQVGPDFKESPACCGRFAMAQKGF